MANHYNKRERSKYARHTKQITNALFMQNPSGSMQYHDVPLWSPFELRDTEVITSNSDEMVNVRSMSQTLTLHNQSTLMAMVRVIKIKVKIPFDGSISTSLYGMLGIDGVAPWSFPAADPCTGTTLRRYYKILSNKVHYLKPGRIKTIKKFVRYKGGRNFTGMIEANSTAVAYPGMYATLIGFCSVMSTQVNTSGEGTGFAQVGMTIGTTSRIDYVLIEDNDPETTVVSDITTDIQNTFNYDAGIILPNVTVADVLPQAPIRTEVV